MTIEQLAAEFGVTRQAISNRIKRAGISLDDISEQKHGKSRNLTQEGAEMLRAMMNGSKQTEAFTRIQQAKAEQEKEHLQKLETERAELLQKVRQAEQEKAELRRRLEECRRTIEQQERTIQTMTKSMDSQTKTIEALTNTVQAQALSTAAQASTIKRLQDGSVSRPRGKWARFVAWMKGEAVVQNTPGPAGAVVQVEHEPAKDPGGAAGDEANGGK